MSTTYSNTPHRARNGRAGIAGALVAALAVATASFAVPRTSEAQERTRINKVIEAIEQGRPAIANQDWRFVDMEHSPFSAQGIVDAFAEADQDRDEQGRMRLTPMVRIPQEGDEDFKWAVKQVLDLGGLGVIVPHVDTGEEAVRLVQAARYPPMRATTPSRSRVASGAGAPAGRPVCGAWTPPSTTRAPTCGRSILTGSSSWSPWSNRPRRSRTSTPSWPRRSARSWSCPAT